MKGEIALHNNNERRLEDWIFEKRREFHRIPELSFHEFKTQEKILEILHEIGLEGNPLRTPELLPPSICQ